MHDQQLGQLTRLTGYFTEKEQKKNFQNTIHVAGQLFLRRHPEFRRPAPPAEPDYI